MKGRGHLARLKGCTGDGIDTHETTYFQTIMRDTAQFMQSQLAIEPLIIVDPFARNCPLGGEYTNDIDDNTTAYNHEDAIEWLSGLQSNLADLVIFDPPFSQRQAVEKYGAITNVYSTPGYVADAMLAIERVLKTGGYLLKFGYNTTRHKAGFELVKTWVVNMGGNRNDVLVTLWINEQKTLHDYPPISANDTN